MPTIQIRVAPVLHERLLAHCEAHDVKIADLTRQFYERVVDGLDDRAEERRQDQRAPVVRPRPEPAGPKIVGYALDGSPIYQKAFNPQLKAGKK